MAKKGKARALNPVSGVFLLLTTAFFSLFLAFTATSPPLRQSARALAAPGPSVHPCSPKQDLGTLSMGQALLVTLDMEGT